MQNTKDFQAKWWDEKKHGSAWDRVKDAFKRDWEQTKADVSSGGKELNQNVADTVKQAAGTEAIPPQSQPNPGGKWEAVEPAVSYGYGAKHEFGDKHPKWTDDLDKQLSNDWKSDDKTKKWEDVRPYVRRGFEFGQ